MKNLNRKLRIAALTAVCVISAAASASLANNVHHKHAHHSTTNSGVVSYAGGLVTVYPAGGASTARHSRGHVRSVNYVHPSTTHYSAAASSAGDYLTSMGGESRWPDGKCIRVYVAPGKSSYKGMVAGCFSQWLASTHGRVSFAMVDSPYDADYKISWTSHQRELSTGTEAGLTTTDTDVDQATGREYIDKANTSILTRYEGRPLGDREIEQTVLHEIGHGLGLEGHSPSCTDIMYYAVSPKQTCYLSQRDKNTMSHLYSN